MSNEYLHKRVEPEKDKQLLMAFERGRRGLDKYNFLKLLKENDMVWGELSPTCGQITHTPTGLSIYMEITPTTTSRHKTYNLEKLRDQVINHLYKSKMNSPINTNI